MFPYLYLFILLRAIQLNIRNLIFVTSELCPCPLHY